MEWEGYLESREVGSSVAIYFSKDIDELPSGRKILREGGRPLTLTLPLKRNQILKVTIEVEEEIPEYKCKKCGKRIRKPVRRKVGGFICPDCI